MAGKYEHEAEIANNGILPYMTEYLEWSRVKGFSEDTTRRRKSALRRFIYWCEERSVQKPQDVTRPMLERYQKHLYYHRKADGSPLSFGSQLAFLTPIKTFFKWLARENYILSNPASELELPKLPGSLPKVILAQEEMEQILNQPDVSTAEGIRDRAMMEIFYTCGIRRFEMVKLTIYDIDARRKNLIIREGKGKKDRILPIGERALAWVEKYRLDARPELISGSDDGTLFLTNEGKRFHKNVLSGKVRQYIKKAGIDRPGSCHLFRHAMATHMMDNGADIRFVQAMLGHAHLSTTQIYTQVSIEKLREIHNATHPAAKLRRKDKGGRLKEQEDGEEEGEK